MNRKFEFQFKRADIPYHVDVFADSVSQAVEYANTVYDDFILIPKVEQGDTGKYIARIVLEPVPEKHYDKQNIVYVWDILKKEVVDKSQIPH